MTDAELERHLERAVDSVLRRRTVCLVDAAEMARRIAVQRRWVYENVELLGGVRLGDGPKAPLRFDADKAIENLTRSARQTPAPPSVPAVARYDGPLLPIRGKRA